MVGGRGSNTPRNPLARHRKIKWRFQSATRFVPECHGFLKHSVAQGGRLRRSPACTVNLTGSLRTHLQDPQVRVALLPDVVRRLADPDLAAHIRHRPAGVARLEGKQDLLLYGRPVLLVRHPDLVKE